MKVRAIINFNDLEKNEHRVVGDEFECSKERANYLLEHKAIEIIEELVTEEKVQPLEEDNLEEIGKELLKQVEKKAKPKKTYKRK